MAGNRALGALLGLTIACRRRRTAYAPTSLRLLAAPDAQRSRAKKAWRLLQGESPCRVRASHPPVSSLASMAESWSTRRTRWAKRRQSILEAVGVTAHPEVLGQLRNKLVADAEGVNAHRRPHKSIRVGEDAKVRRSPQAAACRERDVEELGRPHQLLGDQAGGRVLSQGKPAVCGWGVVSSIVLSGGESPLHGEGLDGSTQPGKDTHPGHVGPDQHEPTSLRAIANRARAGNGSALRGSECNRGTGCGKTARPGLHGGCRVTGIPTVEASFIGKEEGRHEADSRRRPCGTASSGPSSPSS